MLQKQHKHFFSLYSVLNLIAKYIEYREMYAMAEV